MASIIDMPKLSDTMTVGTVVKWLKNEGEEVSNGDVLAEVETDKATMELECFDDGTLLKIYVQAGSEAPIGGPLAAVGEPGEKAPDLGGGNAAPLEKEKPAPTEEPAEDAPVPKPAPAQTEPAAPAVASTPGTSAGRIAASPLAKKIAAEKGLALEAITGSGPGGRILKADVLAAAEKPTAVLAPAEPVSKAATSSSSSSAPSALEDKTLPVSNMRAVIAKRLLESKTQIPHFYLQNEVDAGPLMDARAAINKKYADLPPDQGGYKVTVNDLILKACAAAILRVPEINASWGGDHVQLHGHAHVAFGVAIEDGLVTPVIRKAETLDLRALSDEAKSLIAKARTKKLTPDEMTGSTFTVTNLGMYGIDFFSGIINPPNAAILSVGATVNKAVVDEEGDVAPGRRMVLGLSCDHRVVDGAVGASYLQALAEILESPVLMLV